MKSSGKQFTLRQRNGGFTLIEIAFVLAVIGLLIASAIGAKAFFATQKANNEVTAIQRVIVNLQGKYKSAVVTTGVTTANAVTGNVFDNAFGVDKAAGTVTNQFGGTVTIGPALANHGFVLSDGNVPDDVCQKMSVLVSGFVEGVDITGAATVTVQTTNEVLATPTAIDTACNGGAAGNTISLTFKQKT